MSAPESPFSRVVLAIDGSAQSLEACRQAARLAEDGAAVAIATVVVQVGRLLDAGDPVERRADADLAEAAAIVGRDAERRHLYGLPVPTLLDELDRFDATLLALGTHDRPRAAEIALGGVCGELLHRAACSVLVARPPHDGPFPQRVVVGRDDSVPADDAVAVAQRLAERLDAALDVVTIVGRDPADGLVDAARSADLLVVGSRGLHGIAALGSVSERVAHRARCSVLVVRR